MVSALSVEQSSGDAVSFQTFQTTSFLERVTSDLGSSSYMHVPTGEGREPFALLFKPVRGLTILECAMVSFNAALGCTITVVAYMPSLCGYMGFASCRHVVRVQGSSLGQLRLASKARRHSGVSHLCCSWHGCSSTANSDGRQCGVGRHELRTDVSSHPKMGSIDHVLGRPPLPLDVWWHGLRIHAELARRPALPPSVRLQPGCLAVSKRLEPCSSSAFYLKLRPYNA